MSKPGYIVIVSPSYGGAEKRFFDIYTGLVRSGSNIRFIAPSSLVERLVADHPDRPDVIGGMIAVDMAAWNRLEFVRRFRRLLRTLPRGSSFHYPLNCMWPLHIGRGDRVSMSVVDCTTVPTLFSRKQADVWHRVAFPFVRQIDVLSPTIFDAALRPRFKARMHLTPGGTYLVPSAPAEVAKVPDIVFLGRLAHGKGVDDFLDVLPRVWELLKERAVPGCSFRIAGYGVLEQHVGARVEALQRSGVPVEFIGYSAAEPLLAKSALVLSMQEVTNFPSRVVPEAMLAGCVVIVRATGDSRQFGEGLPGLVYCAPALDAVELAGLIATNVARVVADGAFRAEIRSAALAKFSSQGYIDYFAGLIFGAPRAQ